MEKEPLIKSKCHNCGIFFPLTNGNRWYCDVCREKKWERLRVPDLWQGIKESSDSDSQRFGYL